MWLCSGLLVDNVACKSGQCVNNGHILDRVMEIFPLRFHHFVVIFFYPPHFHGSPFLAFSLKRKSTINKVKHKLMYRAETTTTTAMARYNYKTN